MDNQKSIQELEEKINKLEYEVKILQITMQLLHDQSMTNINFLYNVKPGWGQFNYEGEHYV